MKILIVEDVKISQKKLETILSKFGICDVTTNGSEAVEIFQKAWQEKSPFDLITLDIDLHGLDGLSVLLEIRDIEEKNEVPPPMRTKVLMVTSHSDRDNVTTSGTIGADGYIIKPFSNYSISKALKNIYLKHINDFLKV